MRMIMIKTNYPWDSIQTSIKGNYNKLRVQGIVNIALFWLRDDKGRPGLLIEISKNISISSLREAKVNIRDLSIDVVDFPQENLRAIVLILENTQNQDVFKSLCFDLIEQVSLKNKDYEAFQLVCHRLKKWQAFLAGRTRYLLSREEIQGLYSELFFIADRLEKDGAIEDSIIVGWMGPESSQQDFILNDVAIEIKSIQASDREVIHISSEHQLKTYLNYLYLVVYFLNIDNSSSSTLGESLNDIVKRILSLINCKELKETFEEKLSLAGYMPIEEYNFPKFLVKETRYYLVNEQFPRIISDHLPIGIKQVSYDLELGSITRFRISEL